jgi:hypothetical protein
LASFFTAIDPPIPTSSYAASSLSHPLPQQKHSTTPHRPRLKRVEIPYPENDSRIQFNPGFCGGCCAARIPNLLSEVPLSRHPRLKFLRSFRDALGPLLGALYDERLYTPLE